MSNKQTQKNVAYKAIVYDDFMGVLYAASFLGNRWWLTTSNEKLQPLEEFFDKDDIRFRYLCEAEGTVGALALAKMLGVALENPEIEVDKVLRQRVECLKRLGVMFDVKDEPLVLELEIISNESYSLRHGKYSAICHLHGNFFEKVFDIDAFECKENAEEWVSYYFDTLEKLGIEFKIV